jgi:hypothetical protein
MAARCGMRIRSSAPAGRSVCRPPNDIHVAATARAAPCHRRRHPPTGRDPAAVAWHRPGHAHHRRAAPASNAQRVQRPARTGHPARGQPGRRGRRTWRPHLAAAPATILADLPEHVARRSMAAACRNDRRRVRRCAARFGTSGAPDIEWSGRVVRAGRWGCRRVHHAILLRGLLPDRAFDSFARLTLRLASRGESRAEVPSISDFVGSKVGRRLARPVGVVGSVLRECCSHRALALPSRLLEGVRPMILGSS